MTDAEEASKLRDERDAGVALLSRYLDGETDGLRDAVGAYLARTSRSLGRAPTEVDRLRSEFAAATAEIERLRDVLRVTIHAANGLNTASKMQLAAATERAVVAERERDEARTLLRRWDAKLIAAEDDLAALRAALSVTPENVERLRADCVFSLSERMATCVLAVVTSWARRASGAPETPEGVQRGSETT